MAFGPDPVSLLWDAAAGSFLAGVIAADGQWFGRRVADPTPERARTLEAAGYDWGGPDDKTGRGRLNARDAWRRAFIRAVYRANDARKGGPGVHLELEVGRKVPRRGVIPPGRMVRGRCHTGDAKAWIRDHTPEGDRWDLDLAARADAGEREVYEI